MPMLLSADGAVMTDKKSKGRQWKTKYKPHHSWKAATRLKKNAVAALF